MKHMRISALQETAAAGLRESEARAATELKELHIQHLSDFQYHQRVLTWMSGGYSSDSGLQ